MLPAAGPRRYSGHSALTQPVFPNATRTYDPTPLPERTAKGFTAISRVIGITAGVSSRTATSTGARSLSARTWAMMTADNAWLLRNELLVPSSIGRDMDPFG
jgi:hypothetical protein